MIKYKAIDFAIKRTAIHIKVITQNPLEIWRIGLTRNSDTLEILIKVPHLKALINDFEVQYVAMI